MSMRIMYKGMDGRSRVCMCNRVKFLEGGFQHTDQLNEQVGDIKGSVLIVHTFRNKGGKRLTMQVPEDFDMVKAQRQLLAQGWLDLSACTIRAENQYS